MNHESEAGPLLAFYQQRLNRCSGTIERLAVLSLLALMSGS
ncbi:hypothetical protein [Vibrio sinaloensis]|nr:hypothetical protein [Vibrio sinaloensis]MCZ4292839.1 hypothetical protein [Vibrio sinaloensis]